VFEGGVETVDQDYGGSGGGGGGFGKRRDRETVDEYSGGRRGNGRRITGEFCGKDGDFLGLALI
jgi:hypothetical protein